MVLSSLLHAPIFLATLVLLAIVGCSTLSGEPQPPETHIDPKALIIRIREFSVNLETTCGIEQSLERREFDVLSQWIGGSDWRMMVFLNQVPALELFTDTGRFECGIASKAFGPGEKPNVE